MRWVIVLLMVLISSNILAASYEQGEELAFRYKCTTCHGSNGISLDARYPHLAGQKAGYISARLQQFRAGEHPFNFMNGHARGLTDEEISAIALFFSSQTRSD